MTSSDPADEITAALGALLLRTNRSHLYERLTADVEGVDATTYPVLSGLDRVGPTTASRLAARIGLDRTVTTRYATRLEEAGLVGRAPDPDDARATRLELTDRGREAVERLRGGLAAVVDDVLAQWPREEAADFARRLSALVAAIGRAPAPDPAREAQQDQDGPGRDGPDEAGRGGREDAGR